jgi:hypothetical protein
MMDVGDAEMNVSTWLFQHAISESGGDDDDATTIRVNCPVDDGFLIVLVRTVE